MTTYPTSYECAILAHLLRWACVLKWEYVTTGNTRTHDSAELAQLAYETYREYLECLHGSGRVPSERTLSLGEF